MMRALYAFGDNVRLALGTFLSSPLRSLLTLLGIVIGVATVVSMMALIEGLRIKVSHDLASLGAGVFQVSKFPAGINMNLDWRKYARRKNFTVEDARAVVGACPGASRVAASSDEDGEKVTTANDEALGVNVTGSTSDYVETSGLTVASGRFFGPTDEVDGRAVAVVGATVVQRLFAHRDPLGQEVRIHGRPFQVVGTLERRGSFLGMADMDNVVVVPLEPFLRIFGTRRSLDIEVMSSSPEQLNQAEDQVISLFRKRRKLAPGAPEDFDLGTNESMTETFNQLSTVITAAGFGICVLSLLVGGIGILNIMLVSVTERTREIGLRKALGAKRRRILAQFTLEALVLSLVGGLFGIVAGYGIAFVARWAFSFPTMVPPWAVLLSVGMSCGVGLVFGIYPAAQAAKLDPVEAMRNE